MDTYVRPSDNAERKRKRKRKRKSKRAANQDNVMPIHFSDSEESSVNNNSSEDNGLTSTEESASSSEKPSSDDEEEVLGSLRSDPRASVSRGRFQDIPRGRESSSESNGSSSSSFSNNCNVAEDHQNPRDNIDLNPTGVADQHPHAENKDTHTESPKSYGDDEESVDSDQTDAGFQNPLNYIAGESEQSDIEEEEPNPANLLYSESEISESESSESELSERDFVLEDAHDGSESVSDQDDPKENMGNELIYEGAKITLRESLLAIFTLASSEHISSQLLSKILLLVSLHCPEGSLCVKTLYKFKKFFAYLGTSILVFHYFCSDCVFPLESKSSVCANCKSSGNYSFFLEIPLFNQLQVLFKRPRFFEDLQYRFRRVKKSDDSIDDMYDGRIYQDQIRNGFLNNQNHISFSWWSDGLKLFKTSAFSCWPQCLVINELPYQKRVLPRNILLVGLWFGKCKPNPNLFLKPLSKSMKIFSTHGYKLKISNGSEINVKGKILCVTCDLPAKSMFMCFKQFNGEYGCSRCMCAGARYPVGKSTVQVYPYSQNVVARSHAETERFANEALAARAKDPKASVKGVKGPSLLHYLVPDIICCTAIDIMHGIFLGVSKLLMHLWFDPSFARCPWTLCHVIDLIDSRTKSLKPPSFVQRPLSSVKLRHLWKAAEYKLWFLYYSVPVLIGVMEDAYLKHYCKLVSAVSLLCQNSVSRNQINASRELLHSFVSNFSQLYSLRYLGMNVHQLLHLPDVVLDLGPLWVYSCFFLESFNGLLCKLFHGTQHVALQICSSAKVVMELPLMIESLPENSVVKTFCHSLAFERKPCKIMETISADNFVVGKYSNKLQEIEKSRKILKNNLGQDAIISEVEIFYRLKLNKILYYCMEYSRTSVRRESSYVSFKYNEASSCLGRLIRFVKFRKCSPHPRNIACTNSCVTLFYCIVRIYERQFWYAQSDPDVRLAFYIAKVHCTNDEVAIPVTSLNFLLFHMKIEDDEFLAVPLNSFEAE